MRSSEQENPFVNGVLILVAGWLGYKGLLKFFDWLGGVFSFFGKVFGVGFIYVGFYLVPFIVVSLLVGWLLFFVSGVKQLDYRRLLLVQFLCALTTILLVGFPVTQTKEIVTVTKVLVTSKKQALAEKVPSPERKEVLIERVIRGKRLSETYTRLRKGMAEVGEKLLPQFYDLANFSGCLWLALLFGGPLFFYFLSVGQLSKEEQRIKAAALAPFESRIEELETELSQTQKTAWQLKQTLETANEEIERLRMRDQYLTEKDKTPSEPSGVLDSDEL